MSLQWTGGTGEVVRVSAALSQAVPQPPNAFPMRPLPLVQEVIYFKCPCSREQLILKPPISSAPVSYPSPGRWVVRKCQVLQQTYGLPEILQGKDIKSKVRSRSTWLESHIRESRKGSLQGTPGRGHPSAYWVSMYLPGPDSGQLPGL